MADGQILWSFKKVEGRIIVQSDIRLTEEAVNAMVAIMGTFRDMRRRQARA
jgi:hypothetical protein